MLNPSVCNDTIRQQTYAQERQQHSESVATSEVGTDGSTQSQSMRVVMEHDTLIVQCTILLSAVRAITLPGRQC